jgi:hypothetical protein
LGVIQSVFTHNLSPVPQIIVAPVARRQGDVQVKLREDDRFKGVS